MLSVNNNYDFVELFSELFGELNVLYMGFGYWFSKLNGDWMVVLGLLYDVDYEGVGFKVGEIICCGLIDNVDMEIIFGMVIIYINGKWFMLDVNFWVLLNYKVGWLMRFVFFYVEIGKEWEEVVVLILFGVELNLFYEWWIVGCCELCEFVLDGWIGYVYVCGMDDGSFCWVYSEVFG